MGEEDSTIQIMTSMVQRSPGHRGAQINLQCQQTLQCAGNGSENQTMRLRSPRHDPRGPRHDPRDLRPKERRQRRPMAMALQVTFLQGLVQPEQGLRMRLNVELHAIIFNLTSMKNL